MIDITSLTKIAIKNITKRKKRALLTILGIFIGVTAIVALVSLGQGLQQTINTQFEKVGADKIIIQPKEIAFGGTNLPGELKKHDLKLIKKTQGVISATGMLMRAARITFNRIQRTQYLLSVPDTQKDLELHYAANTFEIEEGRLLTYKDKNKALIGYNVAKKKLFSKDIKIGNKILVNNDLFNVVGILKSTGDPSIDTSISIPEQNARTLLNEPESYTMITAQSAKNQDTELVASKIEKQIRKDRHQKENQEDFNVQTSTELIKSFNSVFNIIQAVFIGIAAISLIVGGIGIMNTMYTAVLERTREIGIMKAIGAQNKDILTLFIIESGLLGITGGIIGILTGMIISKTVEIIANATFGPQTITTAYPTTLIIGALLFSLIAGTTSGTMPAKRASKLKPVEALRYE